MKKILILAVMMSGNAFAGAKVILKDSKEMEAVVSKETVLCSAVGYGQEELKINIAALDGWTILDHSNSRFGDLRGLPCMTAGLCKKRWNNSDLTIDSVLQNNPRVENIIVHRELTEIREVGTNADDKKVCYRKLTEQLDTVVGGIPFSHLRYSDLEERPLSACTF